MPSLLFILLNTAELRCQLHVRGGPYYLDGAWCLIFILLHYKFYFRKIDTGVNIEMSVEDPSYCTTCIMYHV